MIFISVQLWLSSMGQAVILEDWIAQGKLEQKLDGKKIAYQLGSFDPLHLGHETMAEQVLAEGLCDWVLIYPAWGGDNFKNRSSVALRLEMLFAAFQYHPKIIVTKLPPKELQRVLTVPAATDEQGRVNVKPVFEGTQFIGLLGADTALSSLKIPEYMVERFMRGITITEAEENQTLGCILALPVEHFIVAARGQDSLLPLNGQLGNRVIIATVRTPQTMEISSTRIREAIVQQQSIEKMVSPAVIEVISKHHLYHNDFNGTR